MRRRQEKKQRGTSHRERKTDTEREQQLVGEDLEELLFSEHGALVRQHLVAGSKQQTLNQSFTAFPNRLTQPQKRKYTQKLPQTKRRYQTLCRRLVLPIHPSIIYNVILCRVTGGWSGSFCGYTRVYTHIETNNFSHTYPDQLTCMSLECGRKPEHPRCTHADTGRTCKLHTLHQRASLYDLRKKQFFTSYVQFA